MARIKCPSCGAINQDVTEKDACWQCSAALGAAGITAKPTAAAPPPRSAAEMRQAELPSMMREQARDYVKQPQRPALSAMLAIVLLILLIGILAVWYVMHR